MEGIYFPGLPENHRFRRVGHPPVSCMEFRMSRQNNPVPSACNSQLFQSVLLEKLMRQSIFDIYTAYTVIRTALRSLFRKPSKAGIVITLLSLGTLPNPALATSEYNKIIAHVGLQSYNGYVNFTVTPIGGCSYGNIYFNIETDVGKAYYSLLLTAFSQGKAISRVDYTNIDGSCMVDLIEM